MRLDTAFRRRPSGLWVPPALEEGPAEGRPSDLVRELELAGVPRRAAIAALIRAQLAPDSITVTDQASGVEHATKIVSSKHYPVVMVADGDGHIQGSRDEWFAWFTPATNAANRRVGDLFNADATVIVRVRGIWIIPTWTAITGVALEFILHRTSAVGTGGSTITPRPMDTTQPALDSDITARAGATGGATSVYEYLRQYHFNEETNAAVGLMQHQNLLPSSIGNRVAEIVLRQNQGILIQQGGAGTVGLTGALVYFTTE